MDNQFFFSKISTGSGCLCLWVPGGLGESWTNQLRTTLILPLASRQQWAVRERHQRLLHAPSAKLWKQVNVHRTLRPLLGPPRARSLHSTSLPYCGYVGGPDGPLVRCLGAGSCPAISLAPKDHLTRLCDSVRPASSQVQGHPPHSSEGSRCS